MSKQNKNTKVEAIPTSVTHNYNLPPAPAMAFEALAKLAQMTISNADALRENAVAIQKVAEATRLTGTVLNIESSAFTAKNGACLTVSGTGVSIDSNQKAEAQQ